MQSKATTVVQYLAELPEDRRAAVEAVRKVFLENLRGGYAEGMQYGMIGYCVPHSIYPAGYHCDPKQPLPFGGIASQKGAMSLYLFCLYNEPTSLAKFQRAWTATGRKLDMGKSCVRFKKIEDVPLEVLAETIRSVPVDVFVRHYEAAIRANSARAVGGAAKAGAKAVVKKKAAKAGKAVKAAKAGSGKARSAKAAPKRKATGKFAR